LLIVERRGRELYPERAAAGEVGAARDGMEHPLRWGEAEWVRPGLGPLGIDEFVNKRLLYIA
jgi:hypothetical protein